LTQVGVERARLAIIDYFNQHSPSLVVLAGFGGALDPDLVVGDVIIARDVIDQIGVIRPCHASPHATGRVLTVDRLIASIEEKAALAKAHQATVCDMESSVVADLCAAAGVPFVAVRAISDTARQPLSPTLDRLIVNGRVSIAAAARAVVAEPTILRDFHRLHRDTRMAAQRLAVRLEELLRDCID
jgi:adenosylhomocysteine nucleosidase